MTHDSEQAAARKELAVVMPVHNEEACIYDVVRDWHLTLSGVGVDHSLLVFDDGSTDQTARILERFKDEPDVHCIHEPNSGHGPTILKGYSRAVEIADWVFQCDSDDEMKPQHFAQLWSRRQEYDALFGSRDNRRQSIVRWLITRVSRLFTKLCFGGGVHDVNTPYRLMRASVLKDMLRFIPVDSAAPNIAISGLFAGMRVANIKVPHLGRRTGTESIVRWRLWKLAFRAGWQTCKLRRGL